MGYAGPVKEARRRRSYKTFWVAALLGLLCGLVEFGAPLENFMRDARAIGRRHAPSDQIVIVAIDDKSISDLKGWPWPRRHHAELIEALDRQGAKEIYFDLEFSSPSNAEDDARLGAAIERSSAPVTLPAHYVIDRRTGQRTDLLPIPQIGRAAELASINVRFDFLGQVRELPYQVEVAGRKYPSFAAKIAGASANKTGTFPLDFSIDPRRLRSISASDILSGKGNPSDIQGKTVIVGFTSPQINDVYSAPGYGMTMGVLFQALGAETLKSGETVVLGWWPALLAAVMVLIAASRAKRIERVFLTVLAAFVGLLCLQLLGEAYRIWFDVVPALIAVVVVLGSSGSSYLKSLYMRRARTNSVSGLPTLQVLLDSIQGEAELVVAKVHNFSEIASAFGQDGQSKLVSKLSDRLRLITHGNNIYQGDEGVFAWLSNEVSESLRLQLDSLYEIFRLPLTIDQRSIDISLTFGLDVQAAASPSVRLGGALVAAEKAAKSAERWKVYDPADATETAWRLSLMGQLGRAVAEEDIWVAFQPKLDLGTGRIVGAEALARWSHPEQGEISPAEFILAAEQNGRIDELTFYVLRRAIAACATLRGRGLDMGIAVNISATLVGTSALYSAIHDVLEEYSLPAKFLTLEITETAALAVAGAGSSSALKKLRRLGVHLSIDDYGTGLSTMDYLKRIPATELKIDKSFIRSIETSRPDRLMVHSTINLAHSLGQKVVAEGVERPKTLRLLKEMKCDLAQGFLIGRPVRLEQLETVLLEQTKAA